MMFWAYMNSVRKRPSTISANAVEYIHSTRPEANPDLNYARMNMGIAYIKQGTYKSAYDAYESLLKYSPELDEYEGGIRDLMELQQEFPGVYPFSNFVLAQLYKQQGRNMEANEALHKFLRQNFPVGNWHHKASSLLMEIESE